MCVRVCMDVCAHPHLFKFVSSQACTCASMCVSVLVFMCMPCICLPPHGFFCVLENLSKSSPLKSLLWHIISPRYKGNLSKLKLKGKERGGGLGIGVVGEIPVSSENISCPRVLVAAAGVLTHQDPSTPCFSHSLTHTPTHTELCLSWGRTNTEFLTAGTHAYANLYICTNGTITDIHRHTIPIPPIETIAL